ncbi:MAG: HNH endonuclease signature motif containing protein, partial [Candidatus Eisenbacteria bacterium]
SSSSVEHELNLIVDSDPDDTALERIPPGRAEPLAPGLYRVQFTAGALLHSRLRRAQDLLRHRIPNGDLALILDLALRLLIERIEARRLGRVARSIRERNALRASRYVPVALRREVWLRDGGRCAFVSDAGVRCDATTLLEFHHRHPFALGGPHAAANLELRCRGHNQYEADLVFGGQATAGASPLAARAGPT